MPILPSHSTHRTDQRFYFIDALRGLAALSVVFYHAVEGKHITSMPSWLRSIIAHGDLGVAVFFVISGFVIAHSLHDKTMTLVGAARFMIKRSIRLDPPYWFAIALAIGFSALASMVVPGRKPDEITGPQVLSHIFYLQNLLGFMNINPVFWTLCYEIQFYIVFALILVTRSKTLLALAFAISLIWPFGLQPSPPGLFVNLWFGFLLGAGSYYSWKQPRLIPFFGVYCALLLVAMFFKQEVFGTVCVATALIILAVALCGRIDGCRWPWINFLGTVSYSLYLTHNPITGATFRVWYTFFERTSATEFTGWLVSICLCIAFAAFTYALIERPSVALAKRIAI